MGGSAAFDLVQGRVWMIVHADGRKTESRYCRCSDLI